MIQREVNDQENTRWTCVQAYSGPGSEDLEEGDAAKDHNGHVAVVCTPSGGAQTVRLQLPANWQETLSDEQLLKKILQEPQ
ncbi:hypothetical protein [Cesiribacter andamanensis]|uniref:Uncharacterized protein n=1 Tax=Cesiribacter andamanensis AMV16 TaxID=1279009 RepID=M7N3R3_9BACT|nr:hypothetical protein [Cesiribacter andamanensis]EMR01932.1 hypothetical protein ADICEAN_02955 [Cesiribacter andamanensis AMV16]